jgi:hypothetical protein
LIEAKAGDRKGKKQKMGEEKRHEMRMIGK